jgi:hypothetical protein
MKPPRILMTVLLALPLSGCGNDPLSSSTAERLRGIGTLYLDYAVAKGAGPRSEAEFLAHIRSLPAFVVEANHVDPARGAAGLVSDRDGQPIVIRYGVSIQNLGAGETPLLAHEMEGKGGKVLAVRANGQVCCLDAAELKETTHEP